MKKELFSTSDLNTFFKSAESMHDEIMTGISIGKGGVMIEYGKIGDNDHYKPFRKLTVTYELDDRNDYSLDVFKVNDGSLEYISVPEGLDWLNGWNMLMYKYDVDIFGEMCIYFNIDNGKKYYNAELRFIPTVIQYVWEE